MGKLSQTLLIWLISLALVSTKHVHGTVGEDLGTGSGKIEVPYHPSETDLVNVEIKTKDYCSFIFDPHLTGVFRLTQSELDFMFMVCRDAGDLEREGFTQESIRKINQTLLKELLSSRFNILREAEKHPVNSFQLNGLESEQPV